MRKDPEANSEYNRKRYAADPEKYKKYAREWSAANRDRKRSAERLRRYGLTQESYEVMLSEQGGVCGICQGSFGERAPYVDHCHETDVVRGLLCNSCNLGLGKFGDSPDVLERAANYLRRVA